MKSRVGRNAFTLVELLVVIAIVGILVSMLLPAIQSVRESGRMVACKNNLKQIGLALHMHHDVKGAIPPGWVADVSEPEGDPGWGWGTMLLPYMEEGQLYPENFSTKRAIAHHSNKQLRETSIAIFLCPGESRGEHFWLPEGEGHDHDSLEHDDHDDHEHEHEHEHEEEHDPEHEGHYDEGEPLLYVARSNYVGMFGTEEIEEHPSDGDGVFFHNSKMSFKRVRDGLSKTIFVGERSSRLGGSTWVGNVHGAKESMIRIVGSADHKPNARGGHFDDFSSRHPQGAHFLIGDGSVRLIGDMIDEDIYHALSTRDGGEVFSDE